MWDVEPLREAGGAVARLAETLDAMGWRGKCGEVVAGAMTDCYVRLDEWFVPGGADSAFVRVQISRTVMWEGWKKVEHFFLRVPVDKVNDRAAVELLWGSTRWSDSLSESQVYGAGEGKGLWVRAPVVAMSAAWPEPKFLRALGVKGWAEAKKPQDVVKYQPVSPEDGAKIKAAAEGASAHLGDFPIPFPALKREAYWQGLAKDAAADVVKLKVPDDALKVAPSESPVALDDFVYDPAVNKQVVVVEPMEVESK